MPALIIKPRFILVTHRDDLGWYITSNQQGKMETSSVTSGVSRMDRVRNDEVCRRSGIERELGSRADQRVLRW